MLHRYGLTIDAYKSMLKAQGGVCKICGQPPCDRWKRLHVDHDHSTQAVRGLLCHFCNTALGNFKDNPLLLAKAIYYLKENSVGYMHIDNLYKVPDIWVFKEVYALEKIHGTSAHLSWKQAEQRLGFFAGGSSYDNFVKLFDETRLEEAFAKFGEDVMIYGESYGGKMQGMSDTYGKEGRFIAFDVKIGEHWLSVPKATKVVEDLGLEFVYWALVPATEEALDAERDADSVQAQRNGILGGKKREGIVVRPPIEVQTNRGRLIAKHKREEFRETGKARPTTSDPAKLEVLDKAQAIADEWVTPMRLTHVLDKLPTDAEGRHDMAQAGTLVKAMVEDVYREGSGEVVESKDAERAIGARTIKLFKLHLAGKLGAPVPSTEVTTSSQAETGPAGNLNP